MGSRSFSIVRDVTVIGRREDCDLRIPLSEVSRKHCRLVRDGDTVRIEDFGSANGTNVNGQRVQEAELSPGDSIEVGSVVFVVQIDGYPAEEDLAPVTAAPARRSGRPGAPPELPNAAEPGSGYLSGGETPTIESLDEPNGAEYVEGEALGDEKTIDADPVIDLGQHVRASDSSEAADEAPGAQLHETQTPDDDIHEAEPIEELADAETIEEPGEEPVAETEAHENPQPHSAPESAADEDAAHPGHAPAEHEEGEPTEDNAFDIIFDDEET